jgi:DHA1 family arabinose polymer transporter-like MFS transporter
MKKGLLALLFGGLGIGITEFVIAGLLPDLAKALAISIPQAGNLISVYALGVVVGAPLLVLVAGKIAPRKLLIILMALFTLFNVLVAIAPNYTTLLIARFLSGLPHGAYFGVGSVVASRIADKGKQSQAIATMFAGLTFANLLGVPLGTYIGHHTSWRYTFLMIALIGVITMISLRYWLPDLQPAKRQSIKNDLKFFKHASSWLIVAFIAIGNGGVFAWASYIAPMLIHMTSFSAGSISYIMALAGMGMVIGNFIGGKLADKFLPTNTIFLFLLLMSLSLITVHFVAYNKILSLIMTFFTAMISFTIAAPIQMLMIRSSKGAELLAASVSQASFNIGNALGAFLGGIPLIFGYALNSPQLVGAALAFSGAMIVVILKWHIAKNKAQD